MSENVKGEVVYEIRGDDSHLESDLEKAQKKIERSAEEVTEHQKAENAEIVDSYKESGKQREDSERKTGENLKSIASGTAKAIGAGFLAVGSAAIIVGGMAAKGATDMDKAMNQYIASTGKGKEETERYQKVLEDIYTNNYGENFEDIANSMAEVEKKLGEMSDEKLKQITESAFVLRDTFGYEVTESTRAAKAMMDNFGISGENALSLIAAGAQNGLDYSGELLDSINEYSVQFAKLGFSADDMFKIFQAGAESGAFNLDKVGDAVKEFSIRAIDGSEATAEGFRAIGLDVDTMSKKFAAGGDSAKTAFQETIAALASIEDPLAQNMAGVNLFGTMWEDLGPQAVEALAAISDGAYDTSDAMNQIKEVKYEDMGSMLEGLKRTIEMLLIPLGEQLIPILSELIDALLPVLEEALPPIIELMGEIIEQIAPMIEEILPDLLALLDMLFPIVTVVFSGMADLVQGCVILIINVLKELIFFIQNVFTGNWKNAWENVRNIFQLIAESLAEIFKIPINWIIDKINSFIDGLNKIQIPDWVPGLGGKGFNIPKIPKLRIGMDYVPEDDFPALLHRGEAVLTAEENARLRELGGVWGLHTAMAPAFERSNRVIVDNMTATESIDYGRLGTAVADALIDGNVRFVVGEREFARLERDLG